MFDKTKWTKVKLGDIAALKNGYSFKSSEYDSDKSGKYKVVTIKNVTGNQFISEDNYETISILPSNIKQHQILKVNDILISMTGNVGRVSMVKNTGYLLNQRVGLIEIKNENIVNRVFLAQILSSKAFEDTMISKGHGAAQPNIGKDDIESYELYLPPISEQVQIASILSNIDSLIESKNQESVSIQNMKTQLMNDIFNSEREQKWTKVKLGDVCTLIKNGTGIKQVSYKTDYMVTRIETIAQAVVNYAKVGYVEYEQKLDSFKLDAGDILFSNINSIEHVGKNAIYRGEKPLYSGMNLLRIKANTDIISSEYLYQYINTQDFRNTVRDNSKRAVNQVSINVGTLKELEIILPPIQDQQKIASLLTDYDSLIDTINSEKESLEKIKTQLMNDIFAE